MSQTNAIQTSASPPIEAVIANVFSFLCPITYDVMKDPVIAKDGFTYDREAIEKWTSTLTEQGKPIVSPKTKEPMDATLTPNTDLKAKMQEMVKAAQAQGKGGNFREALIAMNENVVPEISGLTRALSSAEFEALDALMHLNLMTELGLKAPQVVVLGTENHGKSTLLERLIGFPIFPRSKDDGICTRCPVRVKLRRQIGTNISKVFVRNTTNGTVVEGTEERVALDVMSAAVRQLMNAMSASNPQRLIFNDREIVVEIHVPYCPNIDILDLPGLVATPRDVSEVCYQLSKSIVQAESAHSIFILVVDSRTKANTSLAAQLIQECNIVNKTLGVFTKMDVSFLADDMGEREEKYERYVNPGGHGYVALPKGWLGCASSPNKLQRPMESLLLSERRERDVLRTDFPTFFQKGRVGMPAIRNCVQHEFEQFIVNDWVNRINDHLKTVFLKLSDENANLGMPIAPNAAYTPFLNNLRACIPQVFPDFNVSMLKVTAAHEFNNILMDRVTVVCANANWLKFGTATVWTNITTAKAAMNTRAPKWNPSVTFDKTLGEAVEAKTAIVAALRKEVADLKAVTVDLSAKFMAALLNTDKRPKKNLFTKTYSFLLTTFGVDDLPEVCKLERFPEILESFRKYVQDAMSANTAKFEEKAKKYIENLPEVVNVSYQVSGENVVANVAWKQEVHAHFDHIVMLYLGETLGALPALAGSFVVPANMLQSEDCAGARTKLLQQMSDIATALVALKQLIDRVKADAAAQNDPTRVA